MTDHDFEHYVSAFETAHSIRGQAKLVDYLPPVDHPLYREIVVELIRVDLELARSRGEQRQLDDYVTMFPDVFSDHDALEQVAFEEYRLRAMAGDSVSPNDYEKRLSIDTRHWPLMEATSEIAGGPPFDSTVVKPRVARGGSSILQGNIGAIRPSSTLLQHTLQRRLRFVSIVFTIVLAYFAGLAIFNPIVKVGLFLGSTLLIGLNALCLLACITLTLVLWLRSRISLAWLRRIEVLLFGLAACELSVGLWSDLFVDHELLEPLSEGDHSLFHYASSWSQPYFALIVSYGILIPSTWRRCTTIVVQMAAAPLLICLAAAWAEGGLTRGFLQSFLLQMTIWMAIAVAIAIYGVHRVESLERLIRGKRRVGRYQLARLLARGGMGHVYLAEDPLLRRPCAIKLMRPDCAGDPKLFARFEREVQVLAGISHSNVVQIFDYGHTEGGMFYYVMEYVDGVGLDRLVSENEPLSVAQIRSFLLQVCSALRTLHAGGLIHRDIKPSNICVCQREDEQVVKLLDFGLVKVANEPGHSRVTMDGEIIGTPAFMSPEQASGRTTDVRTDIYSLGAVAYFMLCGEAPFVRYTIVETLNAHIRERFVPLDQRREDISDDLVEIVHRCLAKDHRSRFANVRELEEALSRLQAT